MENVDTCTAVDPGWELVGEKADFHRLPIPGGALNLFGTTLTRAGISRSVALLDIVLPLLLTFLVFIGILIVPLFLIPEFLLRRGVEEWKTRVVGWTFFAVLIPSLAVLFGSWRPSMSDLTRWEVYLGFGAIAFAAWWDIRRARAKESRPG